MGKLRTVGRWLLIFLRAGALAAGVAFLLGVWIQGLAKLGLRDVYPDGLADFLVVTVIGVLFGWIFGFEEPAASPLRLVGRLVGTFAAGVVVGGALGGLGALLTALPGVREAHLPIYFTIMGAALVTVGLRRIPRSLPVRIALAVPVGLLLITRLLAIVPTAAHHLTRYLFPLRTDLARAEVDRLGWGHPVSWQRSRVVDFQSTPSYSTYDRFLASETQLRMTVEVTRPYYEDACGQAHENEPKPPEWVQRYQSYDVCYKENPPPPKRPLDEQFEYRPSSCCLVSWKQHLPGERRQSTRTWLFSLHRGKWYAEP